MHKIESREISNRKYLSKTIGPYWLAVNGKPKIQVAGTMYKHIQM